MLKYQICAFAKNSSTKIDRNLETQHLLTKKLDSLYMDDVDSMNIKVGLNFLSRFMHVAYKFAV